MSTPSVSIGISMGSESCVVATCSGAGRCEVTANDHGDRATPTYVALVAGEVLVGSAAKNAAVRYPMQTVPHVLPMTSCDVVRQGTFRVACEVNVREDDDRVEFMSLNTDDEEAVHEATALLTTFLGRVKSSVVDGACGAAAIGAVSLAIPRYLATEGIASVLDGAGFGSSNVQILYNDVAAVLAYGEKTVQKTPAEASNHVALVVDWGAHTCCISVLDVRGGLVRYVGHKVAYGCGGRVVDKELQRQLAMGFAKKTRLDPSDNGRAMRKLILAAEESKKILSSATSTNVEIEAFCEGIDMKEALSRVKLDSMIRDKGLPTSFDTLVDELLEDVADDVATGAPIDVVILSGGALKVPLLAQHVKHSLNTRTQAAKWAGKVFASSGVAILDQLPSDEVCALGACTQSAILAASKLPPRAVSCDEHPVHILEKSVYLLVGEAPAVTANAQGEAMAFPQSAVVRLFNRGVPLPSDVTVSFPSALADARPMCLIVGDAGSNNSAIEGRLFTRQHLVVPSGSVKATLILADSGSGGLQVHLTVENAEGTRTLVTKEAPCVANPTE